MPFTVQDLIVGRPRPVTVYRNDSVDTALRLMIEGDYSQLPVIDQEDRAEGMITGDSIVRALDHFDLTIKQMRVFHGISGVSKHRPEDDLFALLDDLKDVYAAVVVDNNERVIGIVTSYDTTEYFRRRGEEMMLVEDIETMLKEYVLAAFQDQSRELDQDALNAAIEEITPTNSKFQAPFQEAVRFYLQADNADSITIDSDKAREAFSRHFNQKQKPIAFEKLTLNDYIELFLSKNRWLHYKTIFDLERQACRKLLFAVRDIRNELAHFRAELTPQKREELRFCKDWLARHQTEVAREFAPSSVQENKSPSSDEKTERLSRSDGMKFFGDLFTNIYKEIRLGDLDSEEIPIQLVETVDARASRYAPLATYLQTTPLDEDRVEMSFEDIELMIRGRLPKYARQHRSWWANDSTAHVQSIQWLAAGWRVSSVNMTGERVTFARIKEREQAYIKFYSSLLSDLHESSDLPIGTISPDGQSWINVTGLGPKGEARTSILSFSFARGARFRVELYIDQGHKEVNKKIFDNLFADREEIQLAVGEELSWERLDQRRASRIAAYRSGSITDDDSELKKLRLWAATTMIRFYKVFRPIILRTSRE
jgi:CBS domain-containing protein